ncbi:hypothetical protein [Arachidicoccus soli]|uniref:Uncharacterized protein n=1 Tax=Arachidicoccus soli TaxID=2341117 RepID=A0A386HM01_9BACT|nr:hypothetical protein [Arachidicoccus soli]AYD46773.1 hypothetical protein D6B99_03570 [Arachidicoccus soli]
MYEFAFVFFLSCKKNLQNDNGESGTSATLKQKAENDFGKAFAKSLTNIRLREVIKSQALKKFDNDYDVLYASIKDLEIQKGLTVQELINSNYDSKGNRDILSIDPLSTVFVPNLGFFNTNKWNIQTLIPQVAVAYSSSNKRNNKIKTFNSLGEEVELSYIKKPIKPTIVIKENERIDLVNKSEAPSASIINPNYSSKFVYRYKDEAFLNKAYMESATASKKNNSSFTILAPFSGNNSRFLKMTLNSNPISNYTNSGRLPPPPPDTTITSLPGHGDASVIFAVNKRLINQRDYIYYGIDPSQGKDSGVLNKQYAEYISSIQLENKSTVGFISDNWTEGDLELYFKIFLLPRDSSGVNMITKFASIPTAALDTVVATDPNVRYPKDPQIYMGNPFPIKIVNWDNYKYGSTWKITVYEYDPGGQTTVTTNVSSTFTTNFKATTGVDFGLFKVGAEGGFTDAETQSSTIAYQITDASEELGDALLNYEDPIYNKIVTGRGQLYIACPNYISTGGIKIFVEPLPINEF